MTRDFANPFGAWFGVGLDMWMLGAEASSVIALRTMTIAAGGAAADTEASRMVTEKIAAGLSLFHRAALGELGTTFPGIASATVADYRKKVRANQRRLTRS